MGTKKQNRRKGMNPCPDGTMFPKETLDTAEHMTHDINDGKVHIISYSEEDDCAVCTCGDRTKI